MALVLSRRTETAPSRRQDSRGPASHCFQQGERLMKNSGNMMSRERTGVAVWSDGDDRLKLIVRTVSADYLATIVELVIGVMMLPFNVAYLGQSVYGLWVLTASITMYFSMLDLGYGVAQVK